MAGGRHAGRQAGGGAWFATEMVHVDLSTVVVKHIKPVWPRKHVNLPPASNVSCGRFFSRTTLAADVAAAAAVSSSCTGGERLRVAEMKRFSVVL